MKISPDGHYLASMYYNHTTRVASTVLWKYPKANITNGAPITSIRQGIVNQNTSLNYVNYNFLQAENNTNMLNVNPHSGEV